MKKIIQTILDGVAVFGTGLLATWIRFDSGLIPIFHDSAPPRQLYMSGAVLGTVIVVLVLHAMNTYAKRNTRRLLGAGLLGVALLFAVTFVIRTEPPFFRIVLILSAVLIPLLLFIERLICSRLLSTNGTQNR